MANKKTFILCLGLLFLLLTGGVAMAKVDYMSQIPAGYEKSCTLCHTSVPALNDFGKKYVTNGYKFTSATATTGTTTATKKTTTTATSTSTAYPSKTAKVTVDGKTATVKAIIVNNNYYVPLRDTVVGLGGTVGWDSLNSVASASFDAYKLKYYAKTRTVALNDLRLVNKTSRAPYVVEFKTVEGRIYVPVKAFFMDALGFSYSSKSEIVLAKMTFFDYLKSLLNK